ncbi:tetratricopeptide repeat protein [Hyalangium gracile]|uniref:tetratricopeptide repeat protein n=1 Tax=Hyalangium gracile TaxID=394092 RepID=UPI001CC9CE7C|nr:tetratricopeptide repeat protein [Hyalangium gracile]
MSAPVTAQRSTATVDVLIVTALLLEYDAVLEVDSGALPGSSWQREVAPTGLEVAFRTFQAEDGGTLRVAVTRALEMGGVATAAAAAPLVHAYAPRCLAMCGVCAGRKGMVRLGDVIIANRLWTYDTGKLVIEEDERGHKQARMWADMLQYQLNGRWKQCAESFQPEPPGAWLSQRPRPLDSQQDWVLAVLFAGQDPRQHPDRRKKCPDYGEKVIPTLRERGWLQRGDLALTVEGRVYIEEKLSRYPDGLPEPPPFKVHVGPIGTGSQVVSDPRVFEKLARSMRAVLGLEMEASAIGALAHQQNIPYMLVMKGVADFGDSDKQDDFKPFAARASAECLLAFLRQHLPSPAFDAEGSPGFGNATTDKGAPFIGIPARSLQADFKGRDQSLRELDAMLRGKDTTARKDGNLSPVFVHGAGGIGKSRLVMEYAYRYREEYSGGIFFALVKKHTPLEIWADFARKLSPERPMLRDEDAALAFAHQLSAPALGPRLIILDDVQADSREELAARFGDRLELQGREIWPVNQPGVSLLITTRMRDIPWARGFAVDRLDADSALELLGGRAGLETLEPGEQQAARELASDVLGGHPLALWLAGAYLRRGGLSISEYRESLPEKELVDELEAAKEHAAEEVRDHDRSIAATYELSRKQLDSGTEVDALAWHLLRIAAFLEPGVPIDRKLLARLLKARGQTTDLNKIGFALARLTKDLALLGLGQSGGARREEVVIHPLIAAWTRWRIRGQELEEIQHALLVGMCGLFPEASSEFWMVMQEESHPAWDYLSVEREAHVTSVWNHCRRVLTPARTLLSWCLGDLYLRRGSLRSAREVFEQALGCARQLAEREPDKAQWQADISGSLTRRGDVFSAQGHWTEAHKSYEQALEICRQLTEREPDNLAWMRGIAASLEKLGTVQKAQGGLKKARRSFEQALKLRQQLEKARPDNIEWRRDVSVSLSKLGAVLSSLGVLVKARRVFQQALKIRQRLLDGEPTHAGRQLDVAVALERSGTVMSAQGNPQEAREAFQRALEIRQGLVAQEMRAVRWWHREVTVTLRDLGIRVETVRPFEALDLELETARRLLEREPSNAWLQHAVSVRLQRLAEWHIPQRLLSLARPCLEESLEIVVRLTEREPDNVRWLDDVGERATMLGNVLCAQAELDGARSAYVLGLQACQKLVALEKDDVQRQEAVCTLLDRLGLVLRVRGEVEEACRVFEQELEIRRQLAKREADNLARQAAVALCLYKLGKTLSARGQLEEASLTLEQGLMAYQALAEKLPDSAESERELSAMHYALGAVLRARRELEGARQAFEQGVALAQRLVVRGPGDADVAAIMFVGVRLLVGVLTAKGDLEEARHAAERALGFARRMAESSPYGALWPHEVSVSLGWLGSVLIARGDVEAGRKALAQGVELEEDASRRTQWHQYFAAELERMGDLLSAHGRREEARRTFEQGVEIHQRLVELDPDTPMWRLGLAASWERLGSVLRALGCLEEARRAFERGLEIRQRQAEREPEDAGRQADVSVSLNELGRVLRAQGHLEEARQAFERGLEIRQRQAEREPDNPARQADVSVSLCELGSVLCELGALKEARQVFERELELRQRLTRREADSVGWRMDLVFSQLKLAMVMLKESPADRGNAQGVLLQARDTLRSLEAKPRLPHVRQLQWLPTIESLLHSLNEADPDGSA